MKREEGLALAYRLTVDLPAQLKLRAPGTTTEECVYIRNTKHSISFIRNVARTIRFTPSVI
jgi:hypothetical protein